MSITEILLAVIAALLLANWTALNFIRSDLARWREIWSRNPAHASDYHAKEILKAVEAIAHMKAVEGMDRQ